MSSAPPPGSASVVLLSILDSKTNKAKWEGSWKGTPAWTHEEKRKQHELNWAKVIQVIDRHALSDAHAAAVALGQDQPPQPPASHAGKRVLIPLSGDAPVIDYLLAAKYHVTIIEMVDRPIQQLLSRYEQTLHFTKTIEPEPVSANVWNAQNGEFSIHQGDFFAFPIPQHKSQSQQQPVLYDVIYDRAAFVAISPLRRHEYAQQHARLVKEGGYLFLDTWERPFATDPVTEGPPFSASPKQIAPYFLDTDLWTVLSYEHLGWDTNPDSKGTSQRTNHQWILRRTNKPAPSAVSNALHPAKATAAAPGGGDGGGAVAHNAAPAAKVGPSPSINSAAAGVGAVKEQPAQPISLHSNKSATAGADCSASGVVRDAE